MIIGAMLLWCGSFNAEAKSSVSESYEFYHISPTTKHEILKQLNQASPISEHGKVFHGYAYSKINWRFKYKWKNNSTNCWITSVHTQLHTTYTLPKLATHTHEVRQVWSKWYPKLVLHEKGHHKFALNIANKIQESITKLPTQTSCKVLERKANAIGQRLIAELDALNKQYDKRTNHGETQGAFLFKYLK